MKVAILLCFLVGVINANPFLYPYIIPRGFFPGVIPFPPFPFGFPGREEYAASLGGAKVGLYGKNTGPYGGGFPGYPAFPGYFRYPYGGSDVTGASLGGAKVGLYGKERPGPAY